MASEFGTAYDTDLAALRRNYAKTSREIRKNGALCECGDHSVAPRKWRECKYVVFEDFVRQMDDAFKTPLGKGVTVELSKLEIDELKDRLPDYERMVWLGPLNFLRTGITKVPPVKRAKILYALWESGADWFDRPKSPKTGETDLIHTIFGKFL